MARPASRSAGPLGGLRRAGWADGWVAVTSGWGLWAVANAARGGAAPPRGAAGGAGRARGRPARAHLRCGADASATRWRAPFVRWAWPRAASLIGWSRRPE